MIIYYEERRRRGPNVYFGEVYQVRSWHLFGIILLFRQWKQLTIWDSVVANA